jgi:hypothetical protein
MKFCPLVLEICRGQVHVLRKERRRIIIIIRNGAKTISLQTFGRLNYWRWFVVVTNLVLWRISTLGLYHFIKVYLWSADFVRFFTEKHLEMKYVKLVKSSRKWKVLGCCLGCFLTGPNVYSTSIYIGKHWCIYRIFSYIN